MVLRTRSGHRQAGDSEASNMCTSPLCLSVVSPFTQHEFGHARLRTLRFLSYDGIQYATSPELLSEWSVSSL